MVYPFLYTFATTGRHLFLLSSSIVNKPLLYAIITIYFASIKELQSDRLMIHYGLHVFYRHEVAQKNKEIRKMSYKIRETCQS